MREIKFRAWDKNDKKMVYDGRELDTFMIDYDVVINLKGNIFRPIDPTSDCCALHMDRDDPIDDYILLQYIGLNDRDGNEIYDGDIGEWCDMAHSIFIVVWDNDRACWCCKSSAGTFPIAIQVNDDTLSLEPLDNISKSKIIGNIYENPELVK